MMAWCVGNTKAVQKGSGISVEKETSGKAKIDPVIAMFNAMMLMDFNPVAAGVSVYAERGIRII
jgi:phage terminase large subunit-like protein